jgi:hypothetical protein
MKLHKHYRIKEKIQDINNALNKIRDGNDEAVCLIQKSIQKLDQKSTTIFLEAENVLPSPRTTYCLRNIKQILSQMCQLRVEIRKCKRHNNLDDLKSLIKKRRNLNQQLIYATKTNGKTLIDKKMRKLNISKR